MRLSRSALALLTVLLSPLLLYANSHMARGVIVAVTKGEGRARTTVTIRGQVATPGDIEDMEVPINVGGSATFLLDGKPADLGALAPGRLLFVCEDASFFRVFTRSYRFAAPPGKTDPSDAWWTVALKGAGTAPLKAEPGGKPARVSDLLVHLQTRGGKVTAAAAITPQWSPFYGTNAPWHDVDANGLSVKDGKLAGSCRVTLYSSQGTVFVGEAIAKAMEIALSVPSTGEGTGTVTGRSPCKAAGNCRPAPTIPADWYAFLRAPGAANPVMGDARASVLRIGFRLRDGKAEGDFIGGNKLGGDSGAVRKPTSVTARLADGKLKAEVGLSIGGKDVIGTVDAFIVGDRFFGACTMKCEGKTWTSRASGYLEEVDAPTIAWGEREAKKDLRELKTPK